jgi:hypothetical protein
MLKGIEQFVNRSKVAVEHKKEKEFHYTEENFENELEFITDDTIRKFAEWSLSIAPSKYYSVSASNSGDYHPFSSNGKGGLVRHIRLCMLIARELFKDSLYDNFSMYEKDIIYTSLLLHDIGKVTPPPFTYFPKHPIYSVNHIERYKEQPLWVQDFLRSEDWVLIKSCILTHMGEHGDISCGKPKTRIQMFVHLVDYLSSLRVYDYMNEVKKLQFEGE